MRNVKITPGDNWKSLDIKYSHDDNIKFNNDHITSKDNIQLNLCDTLSNSVDFANNNYTNMIMSDVMRASDLLKVDTNHDQYPEQFTTSLILDGFPTVTAASKYIKILPRIDDTTERDIIFGDTVVDGISHNSYFYQQDELDDNSLYFNVTLIDREYLTISHNDNYANVFMTLSTDNKIVFKANETNTPTESQIFRYIINKTSGKMLIMKQVDGTIKYIGSDGDNIVLISLDPTQVNFPARSLINIIPYDRISNKLEITNNWVSYKTTGDQNNLLIDYSRSQQDVYNNYVFSNQYCTITGGDMNVDLMILKNQLTPEYTSTRNSAFPNYPDCDHREYDKIFSGTNQIKGTDNLHLGYNSYTTDIHLPTDTITYFHTPQEMYPYEKININDSGLIEAGAIGGDSPVMSDKLFKKAADYKYNSPYGAPTDEETGVWLCTWLRSGLESPWDKDENYTEGSVVLYKGDIYKCISSNKNTKPTASRLKWKPAPELGPVWVDRYYNPERFSLIEAMQMEEQYAGYDSKFNHIVSTLSAEDLYIFDKRSDVTFEPGSLYAYYRIGPKENDTIINTLKSSLVHAGQSQPFYSDRTTVNNPNKYLLTTGSEYLETTTLANTKNSDFTISFNLGLDDWSKPFGGQFLGNYTNEGIGMFNKTNTTPYIVIPGLSSTDVHNTEMELILSIPVTGTNVVHGIGNENLFIVSGELGAQKIQQYNLKGLLVETTPLDDIESLVESVNMDHDMIYILCEDRSIYRFDINNERIDQLFKPYPGVIGRDTLTSPTDFIDQVDKYTYAINCDTYTIDTSGNVWYKKDNVVEKRVPSLQLGKSATYTNTINGVFVSLISEESINGIDGNSIVLIGDGVNTLKHLANQWNINNAGNKVQIISGDASMGLVIAADERLQLTGGLNAGSSTTYTALSTAPGVDIRGIKSDIDDNIWVLTSRGTQSHVYKFDNDRNTILSTSLSSIDSTLQYSMSGNVYMDVISEFRSGEYINNILIINQDTVDTTSIKLTKINLSGELISTENKTVDCLKDLNVNQLHNLTNFETVKRLSSDRINTNHITFKIRLSNYFDTDGTYVEMLHSDVSRLSRGTHNFTVSFNSTTGNLSLLIDGNLRHTVTSRDIYTGAGYKYSKTIHNPIIFGTEPFFDNVLMSEYLNLSDYSFISDCKLDNLRVYNSAINYHKIKALTREDKDIQPITLSIPTGKRSYIDEVKRTYKHRTPGRMSTHFNIDVVSESISGEDVMNEINQTLYQDISAMLPVNSKINNINWITQ